MEFKNIALFSDERVPRKLRELSYKKGYCLTDIFVAVAISSDSLDLLRLLGEIINNEIHYKEENNRNIYFDLSLFGERCTLKIKKCLTRS